MVQSRYKIRVVSARSYHCLFMHNMLIRPTEDELANFGRPDFTIFNAGAFPCNRYTSYMTSSSSVDINLKVSHLPDAFTCSHPDTHHRLSVKHELSLAMCLHI